MPSTPAKPIVDHSVTAAHYAAQLAEAQQPTEMEQLWTVIERLNRRITLLESVADKQDICSVCHQPQTSPSCERREHWLPDDITPDRLVLENYGAGHAWMRS